MKLDITTLRSLTDELRLPSRLTADNDLYVNIGAGEVAIPARIGATPEVTLFTLRKGEKTPGYARVYQPTDE